MKPRRSSGRVLLTSPADVHAGTFREKNGGLFGVAGVAWPKWRLRGDRQAAKMFEGADCTLCKDPKWDVRKKNMK